jgi:hypothetical protein
MPCFGPSMTSQHYDSRFMEREPRLTKNLIDCPLGIVDRTRLGYSYIGATVAY